MRRLKQAVLFLVVVFAAAQFIRPTRANPPTDPTHTIQAQTATTRALAAVLDRACRDCHSNQTVWPGYTQVAPLSWVMAYGVTSGRKAINFSEWTTYPPETQRRLLIASCQDARAGKMPDSVWTTLHPEAKLTAQDIDTICLAARQIVADAGTGR